VFFLGTLDDDADDSARRRRPDHPCARARVAFVRSLRALTTVRFVSFGLVFVWSACVSKRSESLATSSIDLAKKKKEDDAADDANVRHVESVREKRGEARMRGGGVDGWW